MLPGQVAVLRKVVTRLVGSARWVGVRAPNSRPASPPAWTARTVLLSKCPLFCLEAI
jgi:hypothetical protein